MSDNKLTVEVLVSKKDKYTTETLTYCAFCGQEYPLDDEAATQVTEHIRTCEEHPMREAEATTTHLRKLLRRIHDDAEKQGFCSFCSMEGIGFSLSNWKYREYKHAADCELAEEFKDE